MSSLFPHLDSWIKKQIETMELFKKAEENYEKADRLELIILSRLAFQHMVRTIEAFNQWLSEPLVTTHMSREMLIELWEKLRNILYNLIELDIEHTSKFSQHIKKLEAEGKLNPILTTSAKSEKERRRSFTTI
ncbi:MAG: DUF2153 family protein [Desulfurococcaceae archaeon]|uniref:DUF2153 domain-containing protein n=1 Tax=Staphylothermus marinus TaxID=2280 RepID=A0A7C4D7K3_STAMA